MLERATQWQIFCPFTQAEYILQLWDTHTENRHGKRRMAFAVFSNSPTFPDRWELIAHGREFYPPLFHSCDGERAARDLMGFLVDKWVFQDQCVDEFEFEEV